MKKRVIAVFTILLLVPLFWSCAKDDFYAVSLAHMNSHDTYFSIHNVHAAHKIASGKGVKIGIIDHGFNIDGHKGLYADGVDFIRTKNSLHTIEDHGYWLANTLREIAPEAEIYALNAVPYRDTDTQLQILTEVIDWALQNHIDILTYSQQRLPDDTDGKFTAKMKEAHDNNLLCVFIHNDNEYNIWPHGLFPKEGEWKRDYDFNIFHYDYNLLFLSDYRKYAASQNRSQDENQLFISVSSTAVVLAGFFALIKEQAPFYTKAHILDLLHKTSYELNYTDAVFGSGTYTKVVDIGRALEVLALPETDLRLEDKKE